MTQLDENLSRAAERIARGPAVHVGSLPIVETQCGMLLWECDVAVFDGPNGRIYAWKVDREGRDPEYVAVPHGNDDNSPIAALRNWINSTGVGQRWLCEKLARATLVATL